MSLHARALDAAARAAWEADTHATTWESLPESVRDVMRNLVRLPVEAALRVTLNGVGGLPCPACGASGYATTWDGRDLSACTDCGGTGVAVP